MRDSARPFSRLQSTHKPSPSGEGLSQFFTANIRNRNTRLAYAQAIGAFFAWCERRHVALEQIHPSLVAAYLEEHPGSVPTVKQHLAAIRMLFDWLVVGQIVPVNPASSPVTLHVDTLRARA